MKINFPPGWGNNRMSPIIVPYEDLDAFMDTVREAGFEVYHNLKHWAGTSDSYLYIFEGELHGSKAKADTEGIAYHLDDVIVDEAESVHELLSLL